MPSITLLTGLLLAAGPWSGQEVVSIGYLWNSDNTRPCLYTPQEGDLILTTSREKKYAIIWWLAGTDHPYHSTMVVRRSTGELEMLETGGGTAHTATLRAVAERLTSLFQDYGSHEAAAWVRRRKTPLTPEQSARLTAFAEKQVAKRFTPPREFLGLVPFRGRLYRSGDPEQPNWFCTELLVAGMEQANLMPGPIPNPGRLTPLDLHTDDKIKLAEYWDAPVRWTGDTTPPPRYRKQPLP